MSKFRNPRRPRLGFSALVFGVHAGLIGLVLSTATMVVAYAIVMGIVKALAG